jgi:uncharacterized protein
VTDPRLDGMLNVLTGLGDPLRDKSEHSTFGRRAPLSYYVLDSLYEQSGLMARLVDLPADEMTREGYELDDLEADLDEVESQSEDLGILSHVADLHRWGDHYGGALLLLGADDGQSPEMPLDMGRIRKLEGITVVDRHCVEPVIVGNREPEAYILNGLVDTPLQGRVVHRSRVIKHVGIQAAPRRRQDLRFWGIPTAERVWSEFRRIALSLGYSESILHDISVDVWMIGGLVEMLDAGKEDELRERLRQMALFKSVLRAVPMDAGNNERKPEGYTPQSRPVTGIRELLDAFIQALQMAKGWPRSILVGETQGGLNTGSNSGETRAFYALLGATQRNRLTPWVNRVLEVLFASREGPTRGAVPPKWTVRWKPLWSPTDLEREQARKTRAEADAAYVTMAAATPEMVWTTRFEKKSEGELDADGPFELPETIGGADDDDMEASGGLRGPVRGLDDG